MWILSWSWISKTSCLFLDRSCRDFVCMYGGGLRDPGDGGPLILMVTGGSFVGKHQNMVQGL